MSRCTAARRTASPTTIRGSGSGARTWRPGRRPRRCWPPTSAPGSTIRATAEDLLNRALAGLPRRIRRERVTLRADAGYFAGQLARAAHTAGIGFAIGAKRVTTMWRALAGIAETDWRAAIDMPDAQVAVSDYAPADWPPDTRLLILRVRLWPDQVSADPRSRRRRTLPPHQLALPLAELADADESTRIRSS